MVVIILNNDNDYDKNKRHIEVRNMKPGKKDLQPGIYLQTFWPLSWKKNNYTAAKHEHILIIRNIHGGENGKYKAVGHGSYDY